MGQDMRPQPVVRLVRPSPELPAVASMVLDTLSPDPPSRRRPRSPGADELPDPLLAMAVSRDGAGMLIAVTGEIDMSNAHLLVELVTFACRPHRPLVVLDLTTTVFIDAYGITALVRAHRAVTAAGGRLIIRDPSPFVLRLLGVAGVLGHLAVTVGLPATGADDAPPQPASRPEAANAGTHRYERALPHSRTGVDDTPGTRWGHLPGQPA